jgi:hypothetical protein
MKETLEINTRGLDQFIKALKGKQPKLSIGILGDKNARSNSKQTNAQIGAKHEYGLDGAPMRSFLRMPLTNYLQKYLDDSQLFDKNAFAEVLKQGSIAPWLILIGHVAESVVQEAFSTGGFGQWKPSDMEHKKVHLTLVETQQLRNSITSQVKG